MDKGDCYQANANYVLGHRGWTLVHGWVTGQGPIQGQRIDHAWCEQGDRVVDASNGRCLVMPKALYYAVGQINPRECTRYTKTQTRANMLHHEHWGPWKADKC